MSSRGLWHELARDRVRGIVGIDERGESRGEGGRVSPGDRLQLLKARRLGEPRLNEILGAGQAAGSEG